MFETKTKIKKKELWQFLRPFFWPNRGKIFWVVFLFFITSLTQVFEPVVYGRIIDIIVSSLNLHQMSQIFGEIIPLFIIWIILFLLTTGLSTLALYLVWKAINIASEQYSREMEKAMLKWSQQRYASLPTGQVMKVYDQAWDGLFFLMNSFFNSILPIVLTLFMVLGIGIWIDWRLTLVALSLSPVSIWLGIISWKKAGPKQKELNQQWEKTNQHLQESISNISVIQNFTREADREKGFLALIKNVTRRQLRLNIFWAFFYGMGGSVILLARVLVFFAGIYFISCGSLTLGTMITFLGFLGFILNPVQHILSENLPQISKSLVSLQRMHNLLSEKNDIQEDKLAKKFVFKQGHIKISSVSFSYKNQKHQALEKIDLNILGGTSCALIGPSGSGKSTFIKLLNRVIDPQKGFVLIDGQNIKQVTLKSLRSLIGVVSQDTYLFHDTIFKNIHLVNPKTTKEQVVEACKKAQAHEFISKLARGYQSIVGERGIKLSGGERQRLALARIFLADPPILILDESTSSLDSETEYKLQLTLREVMKGRTTILIAHRLSTIYLADQILVMKEGKIIDRGTHEELMKKGGLYDHLWKLQSGGYIK